MLSEEQRSSQRNNGCSPRTRDDGLPWLPLASCVSGTLVVRLDSAGGKLEVENYSNVGTHAGMLTRTRKLNARVAMHGGKGDACVTIGCRASNVMCMHPLASAFVLQSRDGD